MGISKSGESLFVTAHDKAASKVPVLAVANTDRLAPLRENPLDISFASNFSSSPPFSRLLLMVVMVLATPPSLLLAVVVRSATWRSS